MDALRTWWHALPDLNAIESLAPLSGLGKLRTLSIQGNRITDLSPLATCTELEVLICCANPGLRGLMALAELPRLRQVHTHCAVPDAELERFRAARLACARDVVQDVARGVPGEDMAGPATPHAPVVFVSLDDAWTNLTVRSLVPARGRRAARSELSPGLAQATTRPAHESRIIPVIPRQQVQLVGPDGRPREVGAAKASARGGLSLRRRSRGRLPPMRIFVRTEQRELLWAPPGVAGPIKRLATPGGALRRYVERVRVGVERFSGEETERVLPDGSVHLVFDVGTRREAFAVGSRLGPTELRFSGTLEHVGVHLRPGAVAAVLGVPAGEVTGRDVPLGELWGDLAERTLDRLAAAPVEARAEVVLQVLTERLATVEAPPDARAAAAVARLLGSGGQARVAEVAAEVGLGERRLQQVFEATVGLSPKALARVTRFRSAIDLAVAERLPWADVAAACGYYDQAHLTNEFRALAGGTPGQLVEFGFFQDEAGRAA